MLKNIVKYNPVRIMGPALENARWGLDVVSQKYTCAGRVYSDPLKKWIFVNPVPKESVCSVYTLIVDSAGFIPSPCLKCWKVVVKPFTLQELMALYEFQKEFTANYMTKDRFCKCGVEERAWTPYNYGGYFYNRSKQQGLERYAQVRKAVDKINPNIPVILKRYCTEFEIRLGPSDKYKRPEGSDILEKRIWDIIDWDSIGDNVPQQPDVVEKNLSKWIEFAWDRGDHTAIMFNDGEPLYEPCVTYHKQQTPKENENG